MEEVKVDINGLAINYKTFGRGRPILILHGWGGKSDSWLEVGELLANDGFGVIVPDLPGFGKSDEPKRPWTMNDYKKFVEDFIAELKLDKFFLAGHSFGGGLSAIYASENPRKVQNLILCDSAIVRSERLDWRQSCAKKMALAKKLLIKLPFPPGIIAFGQRIIYRFAGVQDYHAASPIMKETFTNIIKEDLQKYARLVRMPTLIVWGGKDKSTPIEDAYILQHLIIGSQLKMFPQSGHNPHRQQPKELADAFAAFFGGRAV